jgi:hypothetical protein
MSAQHLASSYKSTTLLANKLQCISKAVFSQGTQDLFESFAIKDLNSQPHISKPPKFAIVSNQHRPPARTGKQTQSVNVSMALLKTNYELSSRAILPQDIGDTRCLINSAIALTIFASQVTVHETLGISPIGLTFQCDMLHPILILADFELICQRRQKLVDSNNDHKNCHQISSLVYI